MIVDGDVQAFDAGPGIAHGAIAGGAHSGLGKTAQLLDIEMEEFAGRGAFVAQRRSFGRFEVGQALEAVPTQEARKRRHGDGWEHGADLGVGAPCAAQLEDLRGELCRGFARLAPRS